MSVIGETEVDEVILSNSHDTWGRPLQQTMGVPVIVKHLQD